MSRRRLIYSMTWRLPIIIWQAAFFLVPLGFMVVMTFWAVKNYRMEPDFVLKNWDKMFSRGYFWDAYWLTLGRATMAAVIASLVAFPASYALAFKVSPTARRCTRRAWSAVCAPWFSTRECESTRERRSI